MLQLEHKQKIKTKNEISISNQSTTHRIINEPKIIVNNIQLLGKKRVLELSKDEKIETNKINNNKNIQNIFDNNKKLNNIGLKNEQNNKKNNINSNQNNNNDKNKGVNYNKNNNNNERGYNNKDNQKICGEYIYYEKHRIGTGSFGNVFCGNHKVNDFNVAIKIPNEKPNSTEKEIKYTKMLQKQPGFPILFHTYSINKKDIIIESLLGPSLDKLFIYCGRIFPLKTVCLIGIQITRRLQTMHQMGLIHRDLKPNNFTWGNLTKYDNINNKITSEIDLNTIFLIDFGLSCPYMDLNTKVLYQIIKGFKFTGTLRYSSINSHRGIRLCRKDDLESMMYNLIYFYKGKLPWQEMKGKDEKEKTEKIKEKKLITTTKELCIGLPKEFETMLYYIKNLKYNEIPNYNKLINEFKSMINNIKNNEKENVEGIFNYMWEKKLFDDLNKYNESNNIGKRMISISLDNIFKGYPREIIKYIMNTIKDKPNHSSKENKK